MHRQRQVAARDLSLKRCVACPLCVSPSGCLCTHHNGRHDTSFASRLPPFQIYGMFKAAIAAEGPKLVEKVKGVIVYVITGGPNKKRWTFYTDLKNGEGKVGQGRVKKVRVPDVAHTVHTAGHRISEQRHPALWVVDIQVVLTRLVVCLQPDLTVTMKDKDFLAIAQGKMKPQMAFMRGKLKREVWGWP